MGTTLVIAETFGGKLRKSNLNAITFARTLAAKTGGDFAIALVGSGVSGLAGELAGYGAKAIHVVDHPGLAQYLAAPWAKVVATLADEIGATAVAAASTTFSRDLLPRIAGFLTANPAAYRYLADSIVNFPGPAAFGSLMAAAGLRDIVQYPLTLGTTYLHIGRR